MTTPRLGRITRRQFVAASAMGGAAILTAGPRSRAGTRTSQPSTPVAQEAGGSVPMFRGNAARTGVMPGPGPDASNGVEALWTLATNGWIWSSPAVSDGVVYVGSGDSNLYAVNAADGALRWRFAAGSGIYSSPAVADGVVYVGSGDNNLYAVDAANGVERWRFTAASDRIDSSPAVVDGVVYVGSEDRNLYAVHTADGTERWRFAIGGLIYSSPTVADGVVYVGSEDRNLYAVHAADGTERWRFPTGGLVYSSPTVVDGVVYVGSLDGNLYAIGARVPRLSVGGTARVTEPTTLRGGPAPTAVERAELTPDTVVTITGEAVTTGALVWWPVVVNATGDQGWVDASTLEPLTSGPEPTGSS